MKMIFKTALSFLAIGSVMLLSGCLKSSDPVYKVNLEVWGPVDDSQAFERLTDEYRKYNPYVGEINYRKMVYDDYKKDIVDALASGQGPDIFLINNNWLPYFKNKIEPAPSALLSENDVQANFADTVSRDFVSEGKVFALPLSVDSLALFCNKDLFNVRGITSFPTTWEELKMDAQKMTQIDAVGNIVQSGAALGTAYNINRSADILSLLMMQAGTVMTNAENTDATFNKPIFKNGEAVKTGEEALKFYTQFADSGSPFYTWNSRMHNSIDAFSEESVAMMINYSWQAAAVAQKNSKLNFTIVPVPQIPGQKPIDLAFYMGFAVTKNKIPPQADTQNQTVAIADYNRLRVHESWQLVKYLTMKNGGTLTLTNGLSGTSKDFAVQIDPAAEYLKSTGRPAARRDLIEGQKAVPMLSTFAYGNLIATSWYQSDPESINSILAEAIDAVNKGSVTPYSALEVAVQRVSQIMGR